MDSSCKIFKGSKETIQKYQKILQDNGILHEVSEIFVEESPESLKGAGMASTPSYVTVKFLDPSVKELYLFVKMQPPHAFSQLNLAMKLFEKESRFFKEYVPAVTEFCKLKGLKNLIDFYPKCYYADETMLVFENLVIGKGYFQLNKKDKQGFESSKLAYATLAKHHAISHAFIKEIGGPGSFFKQFPNLNFEAFENETLKSFIEPLIESGIATNIKILEKHDVEGKEDAIRSLKAHVGKGYEMIINALRYTPKHEKILTLNHGDYWNNNMLFLREEPNKNLNHHVMFDFQITRYNSPALDVGNFMYVSMKPEVRRNHRHELLQVYFNTLIDTSRMLGAPIDMSYDEFYKIFCKKFIYGFWFAIWLAADAGFAVVDDVEHEEGENVSDWPMRFGQAVLKWVEENPEKSMEDAKGLVELMEEYRNLMSDVAVAY